MIALGKLTGVPGAQCMQLQGDEAVTAENPAAGFTPPARRRQRRSETSALNSAAGGAELV